MPTIATSKPLLAMPDQEPQCRVLLSREDDTPFSLVVRTDRQVLFAFTLDTGNSK
ncbi:hypothetical protein [Aeromonas jandaei]|uniref:hypothetical protein n=1 Tax=Aeromonas jandaei TaxID=650 RepID=UPI00191DDFC5|nr:hypothetical protein [Aeromonas jandaei]MBL0626013.1 hypothetical protein [Aeromonas jandaei]